MLMRTIHINKSMLNKQIRRFPVVFRPLYADIYEKKSFPMMVLWQPLIY
jgi:hypothetical protein